jgi:hypothetical protein
LASVEAVTEELKAEEPKACHFPLPGSGNALPMAVSLQSFNPARRVREENEIHEL